MRARINEEPPGSTRPLRARGTIQGIGDESEEIDNVVTGKHETVYSFGWYLRKMIADAREKGATPILLTLTARPTTGKTGASVALRHAIGPGPGRPRSGKGRLRRPPAHHRAIATSAKAGKGDGAVQQRHHAYQHRGRARRMPPTWSRVCVVSRRSSCDGMLSARGKQIKPDRGPSKPAVCHEPGSNAGFQRFAGAPAAPQFFVVPARRSSTIGDSRRWVRCPAALEALDLAP